MVLLRRLLFIACFALLSCLSCVQAARAEGALKLPVLSQTFDLNAYAAGTGTIRREIEGIPEVSFEISLPKDWVERTTLGQSYGDLIRYEGPAIGDVRPYFTLKRLQMKRENSAKHELITYLLKNGYVLRALQVGDDRNVEALYVVVNDAGDSFAVRAKLRINGSDMVLTEYGVPTLGWENFRDAQTFSMGTLKFLNEITTPIEQRIERAYLRAMRFFYPASWVFDGEDIVGENRVTINIANRSSAGFESGRIRLTLVSNKSLKDEKNKLQFPVDVPMLLKEMRETYEKQGYVFGKKVESRRPDINLKASFSAEDAYEIRKRTSQYERTREEPVSHEIWLSVVRTVDPATGRENTYLVELFTPARGQDLYLWAINTRAYEIVLKSIQ